MALTLRDVPGIAVGHATRGEARTGCSVVLCPDGAVAGVDVRGAAPGTRETDLLRPTALVDRVHAICLAGGSAFGLAAADGVMDYLAQRGIGFETGVRPVPIVPAAIIFDLAVGSPQATPGRDDGYAACRAADAGEGPVEGRVGAGAGATVGKLAGMDRSSPGGIGSSALRLADGSTLGALVVNNAMGNAVARDGRILAGVRGEDGAFVSAVEVALGSGAAPPPLGEAALPPPGGTSTVLVVAATDAALDRAQCRRLAELAHDGLARSVSPAHTMLDGDVAFVLSTGRAAAPTGLAGQLALGAAVVEVVQSAVERSVSA